MIERLRVCNKVKINTIGIATTKPKTVVTKACEIPPAINLGSPVPNKVIAWKVLIMPVTVPSKPIKGATTEMILINVKRLDSLGTSRKIDSDNLSSNVSVSALGFCSFTNITRPNGLSLFALSLFNWRFTLPPIKNKVIKRSIAISKPTKPIAKIT